MQVDVDACYEWRPSKLQVVFVVTITIKYVDARTCLFAKGNNIDSYAVSVVPERRYHRRASSYRLGAISRICLLFLLSLTRKRAL